MSKSFGKAAMKQIVLEMMGTEWIHDGISWQPNGIVMGMTWDHDGNIMGVASRSAVKQPNFCSGNRVSPPGGCGGVAGCDYVCDITKAVDRNEERECNIVGRICK